jgi:hypothetical protein
LGQLLFHCSKYSGTIKRSNDKVQSKTAVIPFSLLFCCLRQCLDTASTTKQRLP